MYIVGDFKTGDTIIRVLNHRLNIYTLSGKREYVESGDMLIYFVDGGCSWYDTRIFSEEIDVKE